MSIRTVRRCTFSLTLLLASALPGLSQNLKLPPVLYASGGYPAETVVLADVNKDGKIDAIVANGTGSIGVLLGNGDGTFQAAVTYPVVGSGTLTLAVQDLNGDGWPDVVSGNDDGFCIKACLSVLLNKGDGTFNAAVGYASGGYDVNSIAVADVDGDGKSDLILANQCSGSGSCTHSGVSVLLGNGDGTFGSPTSYTLGGSTTAFSIAAADLNHDGKPDLLVAVSANSGAGTVTVMLNHGDGTFPTQVIYQSGGFVSTAVTLGDVNGDGKLDAIVSNRAVSSTDSSHGTVGVLLGNGDGTFAPVTSYAAGPFPDWVATGDFNGDRALDVVVGSGGERGQFLTESGYVGILLNDGHGALIPPGNKYSTGGINAYSVAVGKLNSDGLPDVVVADGCDGYFNPCSMGGVAVLLGVPDRTTTTLTSSGSPSTVGQAVTFTAKITAGYGPLPNGAVVQFFSDTKQIGTGKTTNGIAKFTTSSLPAGTHSIKAKYPSSTFFKSSTATITQVVN